MAADPDTLNVFQEVLRGLVPALARPDQLVLTTKYVENVRVAAEKYHAQFGAVVDVRRSNDLHDRIIFVDDDQCWVLGASIKDAALKKPTYLAPLSVDVVVTKRLLYEAIWTVSTPI